MIFDVSHRTTFAYREPVLQSQHLVHLAPRESPHQRVLRHGLLIEPAPSAQMERLDYFGNGTAILTVDEKHVELVIHARSRVEVRAPGCRSWRYRRHGRRWRAERDGTRVRPMSVCSSSSARLGIRALMPR